MKHSLVGRTIGTTMLVGVLFGALAAGIWGWKVALSLLSGTALALVPLVTWSWMTRSLFEGRRWLLFAVVSFVKLALYGGVLYLLIYERRVNVPGFAAGVLLPGFALAFVGALPGKSTQEGLA